MDGLLEVALRTANSASGGSQVLPLAASGSGASGSGQWWQCRGPAKV